MKERIQLFAFIAIHVLFFILIFYYLRPIPSGDITENFFWGKEWQWGYYKHPPLFAWVQELFGKVFGVNVLTSYITGQVCIAFAFVGVFLLAREYMPLKKALFAVLLLEGLTYSGINSRVFNADLIQIPLWVWTALFYLYGVKHKKAIYFLLFGAFLGLAFLGKYFSLLLGLTIFFSFLWASESRALLKTPLPYIAVLTFFIVISPHIYWLLNNDFLPFKYIGERQENLKCNFLTCRIKYGLNFFVSGVLSFIAVLIGCFILIDKLVFKGFNKEDAKEKFLMCVTIFPFYIISVIGLVFGISMRIKWASPFFFFMPVFLLYFYQGNITRKGIKNFMFFLVFLFALWALMSYLGGAKDNKKRGMRYHKIEDIAKKETEKWQAKYGFPLQIIGGNTEEAGEFAMISKARPSVLLCNNREYSPYVTDEMIKNYGMLFIGECPLIINQNSAIKREVDGIVIIEVPPSSFKN